MNTYPFGFDFGNSETCFATILDGGLIHAESIPSVTALANSSRFKGIGNRTGKKDFIYIDDSTELYVGKLALEQSISSSSSMGDIDRYASRRALHLLLTSAAYIIPEFEFGINVVTGLPVDTFINSPELRRRVVKALDGVHDFKLNGSEHRVHVTVSNVIMEGAGAMAIHGVKGDVVQAVVDIGGRTTDLYVTRGQRPIETMCRHRAIGVETVAQRITTIVEHDYGRPLRADETRDILHSYASGKTLPIIKVDGKPISGMRGIVDRCIREVGDEIVSFVAATWNESEQGKVASSFDNVIIVGGGAYYFEDDIKTRIRHATAVREPELANAIGYAKTADRVLQRRQATA